MELVLLCSTLTNIGIALFETGGAYENVMIRKFRIGRYRVDQ